MWRWRLKSNFSINSDKYPADYCVIFDGSELISVFNFVVGYLRVMRVVRLNKMNIKQLAEAYEKVTGYIIYTAAQPTDESIRQIENELGVKLPSSLIKFANASTNYGNWLASLGADYDAPNHILNINKILRDEGKLPKNFVAINVGYDDDYSCIDLETYKKDEDEYRITYWTCDVPLDISSFSESFPIYMQKNVKFWSKNQ